MGGVLLLHDLSDSPYSLRSVGELLYRRGYHVVGLRIPGQGTAPSGLLDAHWEDWAAAVRMAATHVASKVGPNRPLFVFGYSNGAALSVEYALASLEEDNLRTPDGLVLLSPAIGVSRVAALASWPGTRLNWSLTRTSTVHLPSTRATRFINSPGTSGGALKQ